MSVMSGVIIVDSFGNATSATSVSELEERQKQVNGGLLIPTHEQLAILQKDGLLSMKVDNAVAVWDNVQARVREVGAILPEEQRYLFKVTSRHLLRD